MIDLEGVTVAARPRGRGLDRVTFAVGAGEATALHGAPGAGKTLVVGALLGLVPLQGGSATVLGLRYPELEEPARRVGAVLGPVGATRRTPRGLLGVRAAAIGADGDDVDRVVRDTGLGPAADEPLAGGPAPRRWWTALAAALLGRPQVLVLDGPFEHLDERDGEALAALLGGLVVDGTTVLVATRRLEPLRGLTQQVVLLQDGRVSAKMAAARLAGAGGARDVVVRSAATDVLEQGLRRQHFEVAPAGDDGLRVADASIAAVAEVARAVGAPVDELRRADVDLDRTAGRLTSPAGRPDPAPEAPDPRVGEELRELDGRLGERIDAAEPPPWIVVRGAAPGVGTSTIARLVADVAARSGAPGVVLVTPSPTAAADPVRPTDLGLEDLLQDLPGLDGDAHLRPYLARLESGVDVLRGDPAALRPAALRDLRAIRTIPGGRDATVVLDVGTGDGGEPAPGDRDVLVATASEAGATGPGAGAGSGTVVVLNRADPAARERFAALLGSGRHALVPDEPRLPAALLEAGDPTVAAGALARVATRALWATLVHPEGRAG
ncbi:unannotated protein [freshwater metagenome]|uniref:Unannotated protein n=1 Tax=freshwater metagenome TaxID=449393 RepID=A0A6J7IKU5_9ZZZZ|nr:ATP-binding cassette domain-containing protein [Actinomycetota bacterium]